MELSWQRKVRAYRSKAEPARAAQSADSYLQQGLQLYRCWDADGAVRAFQQALSLQPDNADGHLYLAGAHARFGEFDKALAEVREFLRCEDAGSPALAGFRRLLREQEAQQEAEAIRKRLQTRLDELEAQRKAIQSRVADRLAAAIERARREARDLRQWLQLNRAKALEQPLVFLPSGGVVANPGEIVSDKHFDLLEKVVQEYLQSVEAEAEREAERQEQSIEKAQRRAREEAERELREAQERMGTFADPVEVILLGRMKEAGLTAEEADVARRMWLEYRICVGRGQIPMRKPETWAAGLAYTVKRVNFRQTSERALANAYGVSIASLRARHNALVETLDIMPCDYRYFLGEQNPLDRLVEAAELLEELEQRFREPS